MKHGAAIRLTLAIASSLLASTVWSHQPIMDMAPRWQNGYGFQIRNESYGSDTQLSDNSEVSNPRDLDNDVAITWLEGIYTFKREVRLSVPGAFLPAQGSRRSLRWLWPLV